MEYSENVIGEKLLGNCLKYLEYNRRMQAVVNCLEYQSYLYLIIDRNQVDFS